MDEWKLIELAWNTRGIALTVSPWLVAAAIVVAVGTIAALRWFPWDRFSTYGVVEADVSLGHIGHLKLKPNIEDLQIAHRIWTELVTRKAAIPINPEQDVIMEVYDSWYTLFGRIRDLIADIPAERIRRSESTKKLVWTATQTLNEGLRPHLTRWQAEFRNWMKQHEMDLKEKSPQEVQKGFPNYATLVAELREVNRGLVQYAEALERIARG
jgi:hypothetical protein